ncbi:DUF6660 family protein [Mucilaginibacter phyllosphaerae]|uniref:DUF6660 family protein n=1 Tax=Mucilaginibacter phyllosphaerae TaxID=1812349 RepID=UPI0037C76EF9
MIFLSVKPCCTDSDCDAVVRTGQAGKAKKQDCAGCSPFFSCGACAGFTITKTVIITLLLSPVKTGTMYPAYQQPDVKDVVLSIWQPPQLG